MEQGAAPHDPRTRALAYLAAHHVLTLATVGPAGPWAAAVFYASDDFRLVFLSAETTRHARNLAANPHVAGTIHEDYADWRPIQGIQLEGTARRLVGAAAAAAMARYARKFPIVAAAARGPAAIARALGKVAWYELVPTRVLFVDNTVAFGHRDEIPLE